MSEADSGVGEDVAVVSQSLPVECHDGEVAYERYLSIYLFLSVYFQAVLFNTYPYLRWFFSNGRLVGYFL